jgi:hypothetical protein
MRWLFSILMGISILLAILGPASAASEQAMKLRSDNTLSAFEPPESFLSGNFVADEVEPTFIFGKVKDFTASLSCPVTWLIEDSERRRIAARTNASAPLEYTLYLEEDCPGKIQYYVFVDRSQANTAQWIEWRKQFHKSKTEPQYGAVKDVLEQAAQKGFQVGGELRFVEVGGELVIKRPEDMLTGELKFQPIYDLKLGKPVAR